MDVNTVSLFIINTLYYGNRIYINIIIIKHCPKLSPSVSRESADIRLLLLVYTIHIYTIHIHSSARPIAADAAAAL